MSYQSRKQIILKIVEEKGEAEVKELAQLIDTSEITIRRDLGQMAADGLIYRTHGGAMKLSLVNQPVSFAQKSGVNADKKEYICRLAAAEIHDGDVIFMDCGSTVFRLCPFLKNKRIKVITNSLPVVYELMNTEVAINLIGGELDSERQAVHGIIAAEHIQRYRATKAFLGTDGISPDTGLSAASEKEAEMTKAMASNARVTYLLCDSSKLGRNRYLTFAPLSLVDVLVTDEQSKLLLQAYEKAGLRVLNQL
ncbi:DeoR/GlpR family DNA-binding transcription regulator [Runella slithyformis]|uniref:Transcriptional regulator, DeoR family n=1 Tax=Runella slithyformis (strain ATCC 29530 / DSM 19594 / LMG 11500 / NCIMB 11436 / LSU 4) TaxID=761193 RepID=A0A7U3ZQ52_RUNSL|nr:DeoR/GlpR family DNA-binding transcription regulator [Runella slithyformis]AEI51304.1 transcriptional regulator, DeoR family [Runella slithyformis DSM 19594]